MTDEEKEVEEFDNCPFCNGKASESASIGLMRMVECRSCMAMAPMNIWNTRSSPALEPLDLDKIQEMESRYKISVLEAKSLPRDMPIGWFNERIGKIFIELYSKFGRPKLKLLPNICDNCGSKRLQINYESDPKRLFCQDCGTNPPLYEFGRPKSLSLKQIEKIIYDNQGNSYISAQQKGLAKALKNALDGIN